LTNTPNTVFSGQLPHTRYRQDILAQRTLCTNSVLRPVGYRNEYVSKWSHLGHVINTQLTDW